MNRRLLHTLAAAAAAATVAGAAPAFALVSGRTPQGIAYTSGGIAVGERQAMRARRDDYSLWVTTAAMQSGAFLAEVRVRVIDDHKAVVFDQRLDGPWLFIDLPLGRYEVEASLGAQTQRRITTIHPGDHHQVVLYFATGDEVRSARPGGPGSDAGRAD